MTAHNGTQTGPIDVAALLERIQRERWWTTPGYSAMPKVDPEWSVRGFVQRPPEPPHSRRASVSPGTDAQRLRSYQWLEGISNRPVLQPAVDAATRRRVARAAWPWWRTLAIMVGVVGAFLFILAVDNAVDSYHRIRPIGVIRPMSVDTIKITCEEIEAYGGQIVFAGPDDSGDTRIMITARQRGNEVEITGLYADLPSMNALHEAIGKRLVDESITTCRVKLIEQARALLDGVQGVTVEQLIGMARYLDGEDPAPR